MSTKATLQPDATDRSHKLSVSWTTTTGNPDNLTYKVKISDIGQEYTATSSPFTIPDELDPGTEHSIVFWSEAGSVSSDTTTATSYTGQLLYSSLIGIKPTYVIYELYNLTSILRKKNVGNVRETYFVIVVNYTLLTTCQGNSRLYSGERNLSFNFY